MELLQNIAIGTLYIAGVPVIDALGSGLLYWANRVFLKRKEKSPIRPKYLTVLIDYQNWRGERRQRVVLPINLVWGRNNWHPKNQWLLLAQDCEDGTTKQFAMSGIHAWGPVALVSPVKESQ